MTHLLDTDICIYWLNGRPEIREHALYHQSRYIVWLAVEQALSA